MLIKKTPATNFWQQEGGQHDVRFGSVHFDCLGGWKVS